MAKKEVPFSLEAEEGVIWSILLDGVSWYWRVRDILTISSFYIKEHQLIWEAIEFLSKEKKPIDILTVRTYLDDRNMLEQAWWNSKLISLTESLFTTANVEQYAKVVRNKFLLRNVIKAGNELTTLWQNEEANIEDVFSSIWQTFQKLSSMHTIKSLTTISDDVEAYQAFLEERSWKEVFWWSWWSAFKWLDENTDWIQRKKTYRLWANSNVGKTQFAYNVIINLLKQGAKVAFFTLENERVTTLNYLLANLQGENSRKLVRGEAKPDLDLLYPYRDLLSIIDDVNSIESIFTRVEKMKPDVVVLDYIWLVRVKGATTEGKYADYAERIPSFAKDNNLSWIDLSNLPKNADDEQIKLYWEFFGSSILRNNLDVGIHFTYHKPFYEWKEGMIKEKIMNPTQIAALHSKQVLDVRITKNRLWPTAIEKPYVVSFDKGGRFAEASDVERQSWWF